LADGSLIVDELVVRYGLAQAVRGVSLSVAGGEIVGVLGRNGAGKSTLLRAINGLHPVSSGRITLDGRDITNLRPDQIARRGVGHVLENRGIFTDLTVFENLRASFTGVAAGEEQARIKDVLALFPWLQERRNQLGAGLSGGQQQMVAIARALLRRPRMLLLDEPSKGLAPVIVAQVASVLRDAVKDGRMGILLVEQSFDLLWDLSDRICVMAEGRIVLSEKESALTPEVLRRAYFGEGGAQAAGGYP
jgi:branched-chain amino acid transport system ATP-binding protein